MALPIPVAPIVIPDLPVERGNQLIDPITSTTLNKPIVYAEQNVCDVDAYLVFGASISVGQFTDDCESVQAGNMSLKGRVPIGGSAADVETLANRLVDEISTALLALGG
jgi:hypothetical protein